MSENHLPRLIYLASELRLPIPKQLLEYVPQGEVIQQITKVGIRGTEAGLGIPTEQLQLLHREGGSEGPPTDQEWRYLVSNLIMENLIDQKEHIPLELFLSRTQITNEFLHGKISIITKEEGDFTDTSFEKIQKFNLGFDPFDALIKGFYQGVFIVMGPPGSGKTSHLISIAESARRTKATNSIWFFQLEIPKPLFQWRLTPVRKRTTFDAKNDKIFYGFTTMNEVISMLQEDPNPDRILFYDSPDVLASADEKRRFELGQIFRDLVVVKQLCKVVFVASQQRRKDRVQRQDSVAEAWEKAWFTDGIIGIKKMGNLVDNVVQMRTSSLKNRFGPVDFSLNYRYDMTTLEALETGGLSDPNWDDEDEW